MQLASRANFTLGANLTYKRCGHEIQKNEPKDFNNSYNINTQINVRQIWVVSDAAEASNILILNIDSEELFV